MSKNKLFFASIAMGLSLMIAGCSSGGSSGSSVSGVSGVSAASPTVTQSASADHVVYNTSTDLRVDGVTFTEAVSDASADVPPSVPVIRR